MDTISVIRVGAGVLAVILLAVIVARRKRMSASKRPVSKR
jgi:hypothetical protein